MMEMERRLRFWGGERRVENERTYGIDVVFDNFGQRWALDLAFDGSDPFTRLICLLGLWIIGWEYMPRN